MSNEVFDCVVVGGGPAGLSAALYMGRMRRSVVVVDDEEGRSTWHQVNRNYVGFPSGIHATALRELGEEQIKKYGARLLYARAISASHTVDSGKGTFTIETNRGPVQGRTVIIATGVSDKFPVFEGSEECIGKSMFWCIICDGYEATDKKIVVLGHGDRAASLALQLLVFTDDVTLVAWDEPFSIEPYRRQYLVDHGVQVHDTGCLDYECSNGQLRSITLEDETRLELDMLFVAQRMEPNSQLAQQLKVNVDDKGFITTDSEQLTNIPGVYAAGDVTRMFNHQVTSAVHEGGMAAAAANYYLYEDWQKE